MTPSTLPTRRVTLRAAVLVALAAAACDDDALPAPEVSVARVKAVHAIIDGPAVDVRVDSAVGTVATALAAGAASDYVTVVPGTERAVLVVGAGTNTAVIDTVARFDFAREYSVVATGRAAGTPAPTLLVLNDTNSAPALGQFRLRLVHAAATVGNVDVYVTPDTVAALPPAATVANVAFRGNSPYLARPVGNYRVRVTPAGNRAAVLTDVLTGAVAAGTVATAYAMDALAPATAPTVRLVIDRAP